MEHLGDSWVLGLLTLVLIAAVVGWLFFNSFRLIGPVIAVVAAVVLFFGIAEYQGWINDNTGSDKASIDTTTATPSVTTTPGASASISIDDPRISQIATGIKNGTIKSAKDLDAAINNATPKFTDAQVKAVQAQLTSFVKTATAPTTGSTLNNPAADQASQDPCNATGNFGKPVADYTKLNEGTCAIVEVDNWSTKTSTIYAGALPQDFVVNDKGTPQISAWINYSSTKHACTDATGQKAAREADPLFKGFTFTVNCADAGKSGQQAPKNGPMAPAPASKSATRLTGSCGTVAHSDQVMSVDIGEMLPKGTLAVVRTSNHADLEIFVEYGCLLADTTFDHVGLIAVDAWYGYSAVAKAQANACGEARARLNGSLMPKSWDSGYTIHFLGTNGYGDVPATCPAR